MISVNGVQHKTVADAAIFLGISSRAVDDNIKRGVLPPPESVQWGGRLVNVYSFAYLKRALKLLADHANQRRRKA